MAKAVSKKSSGNHKDGRKAKAAGSSKPRAARSGAGTRSRPSKQEPSGPNLGEQMDRFLEFMVRNDTVGVILLAAALITFFSLISPRGTLTEGWIQGLRRGFGVGVWLTPLLFGIVGLWLLLRRVASHRAPALPRLVGLGLLFLVFEVLAHLLANSADPELLAEQGGGGGRLGFSLSDLLVNGIGPVGAALIILLLTGIGLLTLVGLDRTRRGLAYLRGEPLSTDDLGAETQPLLVNPPFITDIADAEPPPPSIWQRARTWLGAWRQPARDDHADVLEPRVIGSLPVAGASAYRGGAAAASTPGAVQTGAAMRSTAPRPGGAAIPSFSGATPSWQLPFIEDILDEAIDQELSVEDLARRARLIEDTLRAFGVPVTVVEVNRGPAVTQFGLRPDFVKKRYRKSETELQQEAIQRLRGLPRGERLQWETEARTRLARLGQEQPSPDQVETQIVELLAATLDKSVEKDVKIKVARIQALSNDLALALEASPIRIEAPVPGRSIVGLEVPNRQTALVTLRSVMESEAYLNIKSRLKLPLGQDVSGQPAIGDLAKMPHLLIAGATGSGKSVCVNTIIASLLFNHTPDTLRLLMVDPKMVELTTYNGIPHLIAPVVTEVDRVVPILAWATREMDRRYKMFSQLGARNIESFNEKMAAKGQPILPFIVIIIDELADLMMAAPDEVERYICRLAQMARATGIHLILATQRPSVDVVTGLIKANFPARIAFAVTSQIDSRVILDQPGAERLLGRGDMLFMDPTSPNLARLQGCFVADRELHHLVEHWQSQQPANAGAVTSSPTSTQTPAITSAPADVWHSPAGFETPPPVSRPLTPSAPAPLRLPPPPGYSSSAQPAVNWPRPAAPGQAGVSPHPTSPPASNAPEAEELLTTTLPPPGSVIQAPLFDEMFAGQAGAQPARDALFDEAVNVVREAGRASVSLLQRRLRIGYTRAARLIELMEQEGIVGPDPGGSHGREVAPADSPPDGADEAGA